MRMAKAVSWVVLGVALLCAATADFLAPASYAEQFRDFPDSDPSLRFLLGTDVLGRDRFSRLLYGGRISLALALLAASCSTLIAALLGGVAGYAGGRFEKTIMAAVDLVLSLPWLFLLLAVRSFLPLNSGPEASVTVTFAILALLGWAAPARAICTRARSVRQGMVILQARACGLSSWRILRAHVVPSLRPILVAQFWISVPLFILSEANLSLLGLGVAEPLPSWGNLLRELERGPDLIEKPWILASAVALAVVVSALQWNLSKEESA